MPGFERADGTGSSLHGTGAPGLQLFWEVPFPAARRDLQSRRSQVRIHQEILAVNFQTRETNTGGNGVRGALDTHKGGPCGYPRVTQTDATLPSRRYQWRSLSFLSFLERTLLFRAHNSVSIFNLPHLYHLHSNISLASETDRHGGL